MAKACIASDLAVSIDHEHGSACNRWKVLDSITMSVYDDKPERFLTSVHSSKLTLLESNAYCAGFEVGQWRCTGFSHHLIEWLPDYALAEAELQTHHGNSYVKLRQAAVRVYETSNFTKRGEAGEIALHAICRDFFGTIPISPRVFYKSASNDVVKAFDLVHARFPHGQPFEIWLGESKLHLDSSAAVSSAIKSIRDHIDRGFLTSQKLLLGPQVPRTTKHYKQIMEVFRTQASLDAFLEHAVFVVGIACQSNAAKGAKKIDPTYQAQVAIEAAELSKALEKSGLCKDLRLILIYVPLGDKAKLVQEFDARLKAFK